MKTSDDIFIQFKIGLTIRLIINANKEFAKSEDSKSLKKPLPDNSYGGISTSSGKRTATISDIVNGKSNPKGTTLVYILESLGVKMSDFGKIFDSLSEKQVKEYILEITKQ